MGPQNVLTQAERYSKGLSESGFDFRGYKAPFLYSTNGEVIWFHDVRPRMACSRRLKTFHISKLDLMEKEAYEAFEKSQGESVVVINRRKSRSGSSEIIRQEIRKASPGDPRYLEVIAKCIDHRVRVLGLNAKGRCTGTEHLPVITIETVPQDNPLDEMGEKTKRAK